MSRALRYYSKRDCPLCEKSRPIAERLARTFDLTLEEVDILSESALEARYGERIPVLVLGDQELGWGRLSLRALERRLARRLGRA